MKLAFFKAKYSKFFGKLIHLRTGSPYSHVELVVGTPRESDGRSLCFSAEIGQGVRHKWIGVENDHKWDLLDIGDPIYVDKLIDRIDELRGRDYDLLGILGFAAWLPYKDHADNDRFCSENTFEMLQVGWGWWPTLDKRRWKIAPGNPRSPSRGLYELVQEQLTCGS